MYEPNLTLSDHDNRSGVRAEEIKSEIKDVGHKVEKLNIFKKQKDGGHMDAIIPALLAGGNQGAGMVRALEPVCWAAYWAAHCWAGTA